MSAKWGGRGRARQSPMAPLGIGGSLGAPCRGRGALGARGCTRHPLAAQGGGRVALGGRGRNRQRPAASPGTRGPLGAHREGWGRSRRAGSPLTMAPGAVAQGSLLARAPPEPGGVEHKIQVLRGLHRRTGGVQVLQVGLFLGHQLSGHICNGIF